MIKILYLLGLALVANGVLGEFIIRVRFALSLFGAGDTFFVEMPSTLTECQEAGWEQRDGPTTPREGLTLWCQTDDLTICLYYDDAGNVCGIQTALQKDKIKNNPYNMTKQGFTSWEAELNGVTKEYWCIYQIFVSNSYLAQSKEDRIANYKTDSPLQEDTIWYSGFNTDLYEVTATTEGIKAAGFDKQSCIVWMGTHHYYNMSEDSICSEETTFPYFILELDGKIMGSGLMVPGQYDNGDDKAWNETPSRSDVEMIVKYGPQCLFEMAEDPGYFTMHTYWTEFAPQMITCLKQG